MGRGRPRIEIDQEQFEKLCGLQCTLAEIAGWFKCTDDTIENWCKRTFKANFSEVYKKYSATGKISLRRWQFKMAEHNPGMAIFLGKVYLGQRETQQLEITDISDETVKRMHEYFSKTGSGANTEQSN